MKLLAALLFLLPSWAFAGGNFSGSGAFASLPGYGYVVTGSYESTLGDFEFQPLNLDQLGMNDPLMLGSSLNAGLRLKPATPISTALTGDVSVSLKVAIVNLATGAPGYPPELLLPGGSGYQLMWVNGAGWASAHVDAQFTPEQRLTPSVFSQSLTVADQNGVLPHGYSEWGCYASSATCPSANGAPTSIELSYAMHFEAGTYKYRSGDPACVGIDCLIDAHDVLSFNDIGIALGVRAVPEASTSALMLFGLAAVAACARRRKRPRVAATAF